MHIHVPLYVNGHKCIFESQILFYVHSLYFMFNMFNVSFICQCWNIILPKVSLALIDPLTYWFRRRFSGFHEIQCKLQSQTIFHAIGKISTINYDEANQHWEWNIHKTKKNSLNWSTVSTFSLCETDFGLFSSDDFFYELSGCFCHVPVLIFFSLCHYLMFLFSNTNTCTCVAINS